MFIKNAGDYPALGLLIINGILIIVCCELNAVVGFCVWLIVSCSFSKLNKYEKEIQYERNLIGLFVITTNSLFINL